MTTYLNHARPIFTPLVGASPTLRANRRCRALLGGFRGAGITKGHCGSTDRFRPIASRPWRSIRDVILAFLCAFVSPLGAHDNYTSWTEAVVGPARLELTLTLARASALRLLPDADTLPPITPETFPAYAARLRSAAPTLFKVTSAGKALPLTSAEVKISGDTDITFHLAYARPSPGPLRFSGSYLFHLVDGHVGTLVVTDAAGKDLGWSPVSVDQPIFEITVPSTG